MRQARQDQAEFKLAMQNFLAWRAKPTSTRGSMSSQNKSRGGGAQPSPIATSFRYRDSGLVPSDAAWAGEEAKGEHSSVYKVISEQPESDFPDMVACNLVQFEYDVFQQIKSQLEKKTNALFLVCKQLAKAFLENYSQYTQLQDGNTSAGGGAVAHDKSYMRR